VRTGFKDAGMKAVLLESISLSESFIELGY